MQIARGLQNICKFTVCQPYNFRFLVSAPGANVTAICSHVIFRCYNDILVFLLSHATKDWGYHCPFSFVNVNNIDTTGSLNIKYVYCKNNVINQFDKKFSQMWDFLKFSLRLETFLYFFYSYDTSYKFIFFFTFF